MMLRWIAPDPTFTYLIIFLSFSQFGNSYLGHAGIEKQPPAIHRLETSTHRNSRTSGSCRRPALFVAQYSTSMLYTSPTVIPRSSSSSWRLRRRSLNASAPWGKKSGRTEPRQTPPDYQKKRRIHARNVNKRTIREGGNNQGGRARPPRDTIREGGHNQGEIHRERGAKREIKQPMPSVVQEDTRNPKPNSVPKEQKIMFCSTTAQAQSCSTALSSGSPPNAPQPQFPVATGRTTTFSPDDPCGAPNPQRPGHRKP